MSIDFPQPVDPTWQKHAACRADGVDPETFFPEGNITGLALAREICRGCPVARDCLRDCMAREGGRTAASRHGIYAGLSAKQRVKLYERLRDRAKRQTQAAA